MWEYDLVKTRSLISLLDVTPYGLGIALRSWAYVPLFVALLRDHDPRYRLL